MSIRLRLTLLYTAILALTLIIFGAALYAIQYQYTLNALKRDLTMSGEGLSRSVLWTYLHPPPENREDLPPPPKPLVDLSDEQAFQELREREIVRVLDADGELVASPVSGDQEALPLSAEGLQALNSQIEWWQTGFVDEERMLVYNHPVVSDGEVIFIVQVARQLTERDRSLASLATTLVAASLVTLLVAFGVGWALSGVMLRPIHRITQTAMEIGDESDFTRRVDYSGPNDEIGQLATTFNSMLTRLQEAYQQVSQALRMQRDFVADVSHELRTPLTTVRGNLALLRRQPPLPAQEQSDILKDLEEESDRLIRLVNDLLVLARADAGRNQVTAPIPIQPIVEEACRQARQLDRAKEIVDASQEAAAMGDREILKQVLLIALDNAVKYSQGTITVSSAAVGDQVVISVSDQGPGIDQQALQHVFDRFFRVDANPNVPGFGLGLPIAKSLIEGQGGMISIESQVGDGTIVKLYLPRA